MNKRLLNLGFSDKLIKLSKEYEGYLGRVITQSRAIYRVATPISEVSAKVSGKLRYSATNALDYPAVGDFVMIDRRDDTKGDAIIHHILPRKSVFTRKAAGTSNEMQTIASNIDTIFICTSLNKEFNLRRIERYLSIALSSGATPVIVLTKSDLCDDLSEKLSELNRVAMGVDIVITSSLEKDGYIKLLNYIKTGQTVAFIGSSGVGKSTLINCLLRKKVLKTKEIRKDDRGRHITSRRELIVIPTGGAVIDTPGMREIGLETADISKTFNEVIDYAINCKFNDCKHENEPGCAVLKAVHDGLIPKARLSSYKKLQKELSYSGLNSKQIEKEKINKMYVEFDGLKNAKNFIKFKNKNY